MLEVLVAILVSSGTVSQKEAKMLNVDKAEKMVMQDAELSKKYWIWEMDQE